MRQKLLVGLTICVYLAAMAFGMVKKQTYTDLAGQEDYLEQVQVGEITEDLARIACTAMAESLPDSPIILRVEVVGGIEHLFQADRQRAVIRQVYAGSGLEDGDEIYVFSRHWQLSLGEETNSIQRGFVNILEVGTEYLVFAESVNEGVGAGIPSVKMYDEFLITPVFCYEERQNAIMPITGDSTYVSYKDVKENEFFAVSEEALQILETLKGQMLSSYPRDGME